MNHIEEAKFQVIKASWNLNLRCNCSICWFLWVYALCPQIYQDYDAFPVSFMHHIEEANLMLFKPCEVLRCNSHVCWVLWHELYALKFMWTMLVPVFFISLFVIDIILLPMLSIRLRFSSPITQIGRTNDCCCAITFSFRYFSTLCCPWTTTRYLCKPLMM